MEQLYKPNKMKIESCKNFIILLKTSKLSTKLFKPEQSFNQWLNNQRKREQPLNYFSKCVLLCSRLVNNLR